MRGFLCNVVAEIVGETAGSLAVTGTGHFRCGLHQGNAGADDAVSEKEKFRKDVAKIRTCPEAFRRHVASERQFLPQGCTGSYGSLDSGRGPSTHNIHLCIDLLSAVLLALT